MPPSRPPRHAATKASAAPAAPAPRRAVLVPSVLLLSIAAALGALALLPGDLTSAVSVRAAAASAPLVLPEPTDQVPTKATLGALGTAKPRATARASRARRAAPPAPKYVRPDVGPLTSGFAWRWGRMHVGIDLAGPYGSPVRAVTDGEIIEADQESGYGNIIKIRHPDGVVTVYAHLKSFVVTSGHVTAGQEIAEEGNTGHSTGPHLHFEVRIDGVPINPIPWLAKHGIFV